MVDIDASGDFLRLLAPETSKFTFQTFDDDKTRKDPNLGRILHGSLDDHADQLSDLNQRGAGISVTINETDLTGRKTENIVSVRAIWQEDDDGWTGEFPLEPSIVVETSAGRFHRYWLVEDTGHFSDVFPGIMATMVSEYGSDRGATDISRALRLPGFIHRKGNPWRVKIVGGNRERYTEQQFLDAFPPADDDWKAEIAFPDSHDEFEPGRVTEALEYLPSEDRSDWLRYGGAIYDASEGSKEGFHIWDDWSQTTTAGNYDAKEQGRYWTREFPKRGGRKTSIATIFFDARNAGWEDLRQVDLERRRTERRLAKVYDPNGLTETTMAAVRRRFADYGSQKPSTAEWDGLEQIALAVEAMVESAQGVMVDEAKVRVELAPNYLVSALSPGTGKTTVVQEAARQICSNEKYHDIGIIVLLSRLEEIRRFVDVCGLDDLDFCVIVSDGKTENQLGRQTNKTEAKVLFTTQEGLRRRGQDGGLFKDMDRLFYKGRPRQVRIWDEAILPSKTLTVSRYDLSDLLKPLGLSEKYELAKTIEKLFSDLDGAKDNTVIDVPDLQQYGSLEDVRAWFPEDRRDPAEALWKLSGERVRIRHGKYDGQVALGYEDILPDDLAPMLVLDASGHFRQTYWFWRETRKGLEFLASPPKRYDGLTIHHWDRGSGRGAYKSDYLTIAKGVAETINREVPEGEPVLVVHFLKNRFIPDMAEGVSRFLDGSREVKFLTWGKHTATNDYHEFKHVVLAGVLQYSVPENEAVGRGAKRMQADDLLSEQDFNGTRLGEIAHNVFQAACRGYVRHSLDGSCPPGCNLYIIFSTHRATGIPRELLSRVFPGATLKDWLPVEKKLTGVVKEVVDFLVHYFKQNRNSTLPARAVMAKFGIADSSNWNSRVVRHEGFKRALSTRGISYIAVKGRSGSYFRVT